MVASSKEQVARVVQQYLKESRSPGSSIRVVAQDVRLGDPAEQWWWVPVVFDPDPYKRYVYYEILSDVEGELEEREHLNVLLVPRMTESLPNPEF